MFKWYFIMYLLYLSQIVYMPIYILHHWLVLHNYLLALCLLLPFATSYNYKWINFKMIMDEKNEMDSAWNDRPRVINICDNLLCKWV